MCSWAQAATWGLTEGIWVSSCAFAIIFLMQGPEQSWVTWYNNWLYLRLMPLQARVKIQGYQNLFGYAEMCDRYKLYQYQLLSNWCDSYLTRLIVLGEVCTVLTGKVWWDPKLSSRVLESDRLRHFLNWKLTLCNKEYLLFILMSIIMIYVSNPPATGDGASEVGHFWKYILASVATPTLSIRHTPPKKLIN